MRIRSLGTKITVVIATIILLKGVSIIVVEQVLLRESFSLALIETGIADTKHLAAISVNPILTGDKQFLHNLVEEKNRTSSDIVCVFVVDNENTILAHTFSEGFPLYLLWANKVDSTENSSTKLLETEEGVIYDFTVKIESQSKNQTLGTARIGMSLKSLEGTIIDINILSLTTVLIISLIGSMVAIGLTRHIVKPIKNLHQSTEMIIEIGSHKE